MDAPCVRRCVRHPPHALRRRAALAQRLGTWHWLSSFRFVAREGPTYFSKLLAVSALRCSTPAAGRRGSSCRRPWPRARWPGWRAAVAPAFRRSDSSLGRALWTLLRARPRLAAAGACAACAAYASQWRGARGGALMRPPPPPRTPRARAACAALSAFSAAAARCKPARCLRWSAAPRLRRPLRWARAASRRTGAASRRRVASSRRSFQYGALVANRRLRAR